MCSETGRLSGRSQNGTTAEIVRPLLYFKRILNDTPVKNVVPRESAFHEEISESLAKSTVVRFVSEFERANVAEVEEKFTRTPLTEFFEWLPDFGIPYFLVLLFFSGGA